MLQGSSASSSSGESLSNDTPKGWKKRKPASDGQFTLLHIKYLVPFSIIKTLLKVLKYICRLADSPINQVSSLGKYSCFSDTKC